MADSFAPCFRPCAEEPCREGIQSCRDANSFSTNSRGIVRCCMPGYAINSVSSSFVNGHLVDICTCTRTGSGGFLSSFMGLDNTGQVMISSGNGGAQVYPSARGSTVNMTEVREKWRQMGEGWKQWGQQFGNNFRTWGQNFARSMHHTGRELARSLTGTLHNTLQRTLGSLFKSF
ncbi:hypothetical protein C0Q70_08065 [Pomacea canaliculata]|uniref:Uncharacterized protein n=1 Tax=Pomacea canaliculata TaxID=400727 RepID=A0A2T7PGT5_POMCA|nr:hypothetical protein C0Q70_08065 [Pomacea canaliculata]